MPSLEEILSQLVRSANEFKHVAIAWHALFYATIIALRIGRAPSAGTLAFGLTLPVVSVAAIAAIAANYFNAAMFGALALVLISIAGTRGVGRAELTTGRAAAIGAVVVAYAVTYPHFAHVEQLWLFAFMAPLGVVPCPTLALLVGTSLLGNSFGSRIWAWTVAAFALLYGLFGVFALGVWLDLGLLIGAVALLAHVPMPRHKSTGQDEAYAHSRILAITPNRVRRRDAR